MVIPPPLLNNPVDGAVELVSLKAPRSWFV
jgi:hypothetical protein